MRIAVVGMLCEPSGATEGSISWHWAKAYQSLGHDVTLFTQASQQSNFSPHDVESMDIRVVGGSKRVVKSPHSLIQALRLFGQLIRWRREIRNVTAELASYDLVHQVSISTIRVPTSLSALGPRLIWGPVGGGHLGITRGVRGGEVVLERVRNFSIQASHALYRATGWFRRFHGLVLTTNHGTFEFARSLGAANVGNELIDGVAPSWLTRRDEVSTDGYRMLWAGRLVSSKRPDLAIRTLAAVAEDRLDATLTICGDGPRISYLRQLARSLGVDSRVEFLGRVSHEEVRARLMSSDIALFTSFRDSSSPFLLEAAAAGRRCVAIRAHGVATCFPEGIVPGPSPDLDDEELVTALARVIGEPTPADPSSQYDFAHSHLWTSKAARMLQHNAALLATSGTL